MSPTRILPNLHQLIVPTPFPVGPVNVYLGSGPGEPLTLIDTGPQMEEARAALEAGLAALGYRLADVQRVIITHAHTDHYGLAGDVARSSGARVYSHPYNRPTLENHPEEREQRAVFYRELLVEAGVPPDLQRTVLQTLAGYRHLATEVAVVQPLDEGDQVRLAGRDWRVLFTPGHAGGLICLYQPDAQLLLSNDHLLRDVSSNPLLEPPPPGQSERRRSLVDYIASLERTRAMAISVAWPGHGEPIYRPHELIEKRLGFHAQRAERIMTALQNGPHTIYDLAQVIFARLRPMDHFLAFSEVLAHLEWLEVQGKVERGTRNGAVEWRGA